MRTNPNPLEDLKRTIEQLGKLAGELAQIVGLTDLLPDSIKKDMLAVSKALLERAALPVDSISAEQRRAKIEQLEGAVQKYDFQTKVARQPIEARRQPHSGYRWHVPRLVLLISGAMLWTVLRPGSAGFSPSGLAIAILAGIVLDLICALSWDTLLALSDLAAWLRAGHASNSVAKQARAAQDEADRAEAREMVGKQWIQLAMDEQDSAFNREYALSRTAREIAIRNGGNPDASPLTAASET